MAKSPRDPPHDPFAPTRSRSSKKKKTSPTAHDKPRNRLRRPRGQSLPLNQQIDRLKAQVGEQGINDAKALLKLYPPEVIKLAFKLLPKRHVAKLGKRTEDLLKLVPKTDRPEVEASLEKALEKKMKGPDQ
jgi:hypothetical protein